MALTERTELAQITRDITSGTIMVRWDNVIERDGVVIQRLPHRKAYGQDQKSELLAECPDAAQDVAALGW